MVVNPHDQRTADFRADHDLRDHLRPRSFDLHTILRIYWPAKVLVRGDKRIAEFSRAVISIR